MLNCNVKTDVIWCWKTQQSDVNAIDPSGNTATHTSCWFKCSAFRM